MKYKFSKLPFISENFEFKKDLYHHPTIVFLNLQVKQCKALIGDFKTSFRCDNITPNCLAQHGIELLLELKESLFTPNVFGCLCIGTEVRFIFNRFLFKSLFVFVLCSYLKLCLLR